jgi:predicted ribosomally synthesized peptide with nif11-like leader
MSLQSVRKFAERLSEDAKLRARVSEAGSADDVVAIAGDAGFKVSIDDLEAFAATWDEASRLELSPEELEGGVKAVKTKGRCKTIGRCFTKPKTCGTPCCTIEPIEPTT